MPVASDVACCPLPEILNHISCIGHRGAAGYAPENTLASFGRAIQLGVDYVECDFHITADGVPVIIHDETLDRTTSGHGPVREKTLAEVKALDAGSWHGAEFAREKVPTLCELFELAAGRAGVVAEAKSPASQHPDAPQLLAGLVKEFAHVPVIAISVDDAFLRRFKELCPDVPAGLLSNLREGPRRAVARAVRASCDILSVNFKQWDKRLPEQAARAGLQLAVWTVNEPEDIAAFLSKEIASITTDYPDRVLEHLARRRRNGGGESEAL